MRTMDIIFEGQPPYALPPAQSAKAHAVGDVVMVTLYVAIRDKRPSPSPIQIQMTAQVTQALAAQLRSAGVTAEVQAGKS
jgi:hypothetical protein